MTGMDRWIDWDKDFVGKDAAVAERDGNGPAQVQVTLEVDALDADASGYEPIWSNGERVGFVTSGGYGHYTGKSSLAMALVNRDKGRNGHRTERACGWCRAHSTGDCASPYDPQGKAMRG